MRKLILANDSFVKKIEILAKMTKPDNRPAVSLNMKGG